MKNRSKALAALALAGTLVLNPMKATANTINNYDLSTSADEENKDSVDNIFSENSDEELDEDFPYSSDDLVNFNVFYKLCIAKDNMDFQKETFGSISQARRSQGIEVNDETAKKIDETSDYIYQCICKYLDAYDRGDRDTCYNTIKELLESYAAFKLYSIFTIGDVDGSIIDYYDGVFTILYNNKKDYRMFNIVEICDTLPYEPLDLDWIRLASTRSLDEYAPIYKNDLVTTLTNKTILEYWYNNMKELEIKEHEGDNSFLYQQVKYNSSGNNKQNVAPVYKKTRYKPNSAPKGQRARYYR